MKKIIALVLSLVMICCFAVTAFAAESPVAAEKVTVTVRKGTSSVGGQTFKADVVHNVDNGTTIVLKADATLGKFNNWVFYTADGKTLAAGTDYEIVKGTLNDSEVTIKLNKSVIICANYNDVKTDPNLPSNTDKSDSAPQTGDTVAPYVALVMLCMVAFGFGAKKVYSK